MNTRRLPLLILAAALAGPGCQAPSAPAPASTSANAVTSTPTAGDMVERGEYLTRIAGCNDCHTEGFNESAGTLPKEKWLLGNRVGFNGPWGTTFAANLRLKAADMDDAGWLKYTGELHTRPIMPDFMLRSMKAEDRLAIFRFIKSLGPAGEPAPDYLPPGQQPVPPYWSIVEPQA